MCDTVSCELSRTQPAVEVLKYFTAFDDKIKSRSPLSSLANKVRCKRFSNPEEPVMNEGHLVDLEYNSAHRDLYLVFESHFRHETRISAWQMTSVTDWFSCLHASTSVSEGVVSSGLISGTPGWKLKFGTNVHVDLRMNWKDFGGQRSKVTVIEPSTRSVCRNQRWTQPSSLPVPSSSLEMSSLSFWRSALLCESLFFWEIIFQ